MPDEDLGAMGSSITRLSICSIKRSLSYSFIVEGKLTRQKIVVNPND